VRSLAPKSSAQAPELGLCPPKCVDVHHRCWSVAPPNGTAELLTKGTTPCRDSLEGRDRPPLTATARWCQKLQRRWIGALQAGSNREGRQNPPGLLACRALSPAHAKALITASQELRLGALCCSARPGESARSSALRGTTSALMPALPRFNMENHGPRAARTLYDGEKLSIVFTGACDGLATSVTEESSELPFSVALRPPDPCSTARVVRSTRGMARERLDAAIRRRRAPCRLAKRVRSIFGRSSSGG